MGEFRKMRDRQKRRDDRSPRPPRPPRSRDAERSPERRSHDVIYGIQPVTEALRSERRLVERVMIAEGSQDKRFDRIVALCRDAGVPWDRVPRERFARNLPAEANHQGVAAIAAASTYVEVDEILDASELPLILVADGIEDPRNLGAMLRSAECAGVDGVIIPERRAVGLNETVARSSAGAIEHIRVAKTGNLNRLIDDMKRRNIWVVGTSMDATSDHTEWDWRQPSALIVGSEGTGLHRLVAENCDTLVKIPMYGKIDSLNVSVATGVILFEARRQRKTIAG